jgi:SAM-dependent methyltransferase
MGIKPGMKVLDVGCGVGGPAREIVKFTGAHVTGLNITEYQVERARVYADKEGLSHKLKFVQGDFMVSLFLLLCCVVTYQECLLCRKFRSPTTLSTPSTPSKLPCMPLH